MRRVLFFLFALCSSFLNEICGTNAASGGQTFEGVEFPNFIQIYSVYKNSPGDVFFLARNEKTGASVVLSGSGNEIWPHPGTVPGEALEKDKQDGKATATEQEGRNFLEKLGAKDLWQKGGNLSVSLHDGASAKMMFWGSGAYFCALTYGTYLQIQKDDKIYTKIVVQILDTPKEEHFSTSCKGYSGTPGKTEKVLVRLPKNDVALLYKWSADTFLYVPFEGNFAVIISDDGRLISRNVHGIGLYDANPIFRAQTDGQGNRDGTLSEINGRIERRIFQEIDREREEGE